MAVLRHRVVRAYTALALGALLFLIWPLLLLDPLGGTLPFAAAITTRTLLCLNGAGAMYCLELFILCCTILAMSLALGGRNLRHTVFAGLLLTPPLLFYAVRYPFWIIAFLLMIAPLLINAVLNTWFPNP